MSATRGGICSTGSPSRSFIANKDGEYKSSLLPTITGSRDIGRVVPGRMKNNPESANLSFLYNAEGRMIADLVACIGSIDIVLGEIDR